MIRKFLLYAGRWQLSTPILSPMVALFQGSPIWGTPESWAGATMANIIGASIFFWVDRFIFTSYAVELWNFKDSGTCDNCGEVAPLWRLVKAPNYDKSNSEPKFYCMKCSKEKTNELRKKGIKVRGKSH
ncbi:MAG: hypothetical protein WC516_07845 [Patescibacteria group bacterium]